MFRVIKVLEFCFGHRLLGHQGKCAHLHGHNGVVEIEFSAKDLDDQGMVMDFVEIKKEINSFLEKEMDHKMLLKKDDPFVPLLQERGEPVYVMEKNPTVENIAQEIFNFATSRGLPVSSVRIWESRGNCAEYRQAEE